MYGDPGFSGSLLQAGRTELTQFLLFSLISPLIFKNLKLSNHMSALSHQSNLEQFTGKIKSYISFYSFKREKM